MNDEIKDIKNKSDHDLLIILVTEMRAVMKSYVSKEEFEPVKKLVYGVTAIMTTGVVISLIALVIK